MTTETIWSAIPETPHACLCEAWRLQERRQRYERERARRSPDIAKLDRRIDGLLRLRAWL